MGSMASPYYPILSVAAATSATASAATVAKEEEYEADSDDDPDVFTVKKIAQAVHKASPFKEHTGFVAPWYILCIPLQKW